MYYLNDRYRIIGFFAFRTPRYLLRSPEAIKQITIKDFDYFENRRPFFDRETDPVFGSTMPFLKGDEWRSLRAAMSPAFTGSRIKQMFELIDECADDVVKHFTSKSDNGEMINVEMRDIALRYLTDVIASCVFGLKTNSLAEPENEFFMNGKALLNFTSIKNVCKVLLMSRLPVIARALNLTLSQGSAGQSFRNIILDTIKTREQNNIQRPDMINILMQIKNGTLKPSHERNEKEKEAFATTEESNMEKIADNYNWTDDEIVAQCLTFFLAGIDGAPTIISFAAYELAVNPDIQQKLYEEILETSEQMGGKRVNYDALQKMKYLDQVISETLRKWPAGFQTDRVCAKEYVYSDGDKLKFKIEKGAVLVLPVYAIHHDPKFYPNPDKFDPERFSDDNKSNILSGTYVPFGVGPRNCIASRFAIVETKALLYNLLLKFSFEPNAHTPIPPKMQKSPISFALENGFPLELKPRKAQTPLKP